MTAYPDYFSTAAAAYALYRPQYPEELFDFLAAGCQRRDRAWDCGTGSGQAALPLASRFEAVIATDPSVAQLQHAVQHPNITYVAATAEDSALDRHSTSLVTVAQALHWFRLTDFYTEVRRIVRPGGLIATWTYSLFSTGDEGLDTEIGRFYKHEVGAYWPAERALVDAGYRDIQFPFEPVAVPELAMTAAWSLLHFAGYLGTWSAVNRYRRSTGHDPVPPFIERLAPLWGREGSVRQVKWPLEVKVGRL